MFEVLEDFMFAKDAFYFDIKKPSDNKYWESKMGSLSQPNMTWVSTLEEKFFHSIYRGSILSIFHVLTDETSHLNKEPRTEYFKSKTYTICSDILTEASRGLRTGVYQSSQEIIVKLRWYIFEAAKIEEQNKRALLNSYQRDKAIEPTEVLNVCNYFTSINLKWSLMLVYRQISIIDNIIITDWKEDSFLKNMLTEKFDIQIFNVMMDYTLKNLKKDSGHIQDLYISLKNMYINSYLLNELSTLNEYEIKKNLANIENWILIILIIPDLLEEPIRYSLSQASEQEDVILNEIYESIKGELYICDLPTDAIFLIQDKVDTIKTILEIKSVDNEIYQIDSIPRNLVTKLELELQTLISNPNIDVRALYESKIKPIQTNLSVPELALLFRILVDEKIVKLSGSKVDLFRSITKLFQSKSSTSISEDSFKNKYNSPESSAIDFWDEKFNDFRDNVLEYKN